MNHKQGPECDGCGERDESTTERLDPFMYEIHDEEHYVFWCDDCWQQRKDDI